MEPATATARVEPPEPPPPPTQAQIDELYRNARLGFPAPLRIPLASGVSFLVGLGLGTTQGSRMVGLRFRAEHAHKLPTTTTGWFLYHKSKNYHVAHGGLREGLRMGTKICFWTTTMFAIENMFDNSRGQKDLINTVLACVTVAGGFSVWSTVTHLPYSTSCHMCVRITDPSSLSVDRFSLPMAARTTKTALVVGFVYGGLQDLAGAARGRPIGYVEFIKRQLGGRRKEEAAVSG